MKKNKLALCGGIFLILISLIAIFGPTFARFSFDSQDMTHILATPNSMFWFGTDGLGRDLFARIVFGARVSLSVGFISGALSLVIGTIYGAIAGFFGLKVDTLLMGLVDLVQSLPPLVLMILVSVIFNAYSFFEHSEVLRDTLGMILALSLVGWVGVARLVRNQVLQIRKLPFIEAARASGGENIRIITRHILPQLSGSLIIVFTHLVPSQILYESFLSFIGLGLQPPYSSWGVLANEGWRSFRTYPHLILFPGMAIFLTMLASQFLGDGLRDDFDPQFKNEN
jgi:oligopeptide transport system permease protein